MLSMTMSLKTILSSSTDYSSTRSSLRGSQGISFGSVEIREYERIYATDVWDVCYPLTLGWGFKQRPTMSVQEFERQVQRKADKERRKLGYSFLRRRTSFRADKTTQDAKTSQYMEPLDCDRRRKLLLSFGHSEQEIKRAEKDRLLKLRHFMMM